MVLDVFSRRVVGWSIDSRPQASLATNALAMAINNREPHGSTIHSDHGTQFTSWAFTQRARDAGLAVSMGSIGDCLLTPSSSRSGPACKSSCSTEGVGEHALSSPTPSSSTLRSSTTGRGGTHHSACSRPSNTRSATPPPPEIKQTDRAKHRAHQTLQEYQGDSLCRRLMAAVRSLLSRRMVPWSSRSALSQDCSRQFSLRRWSFGFVRFVLRWVGGCSRGW